MSLELQLVRAWIRYLEHLAGKHNQKTHGQRGGMAIIAGAPTTGWGEETIFTGYEGKAPWTMTKNEYEKRYQFPQSMWDDLRNNAPYIDNNNNVVTLSPSTGKKGYTRINHYNNRGIEYHEEFKNDSPELKRAIQQLAPKNSFTAVVKTDLTTNDIADVDLHRVVTTARGKIRAVTGNAKQVAKTLNRVQSEGGQIVKKQQNTVKAPKKSDTARWTVDTKKPLAIPDHKILLQVALSNNKKIPAKVLNDYPDLKEEAMKKRLVEHLAGKHNQKTHGNRFGSYSKAKATMKRLKDDKEAREKYKARARKRAGMPAKKQRQPKTIDKEYPTMRKFLKGDVSSLVDKQAKKMMKADPKISPNLAKEQAAAVVLRDYIREQSKLDKAIRGKASGAKQKYYDLYDEIEFAPETIQNQLIKASGSRTLVSDVQRLLGDKDY